jgi:large repetitive protein
MRGLHALLSSYAARPAAGGRRSSRKKLGAAATVATLVAALLSVTVATSQSAGADTPTGPGGIVQPGANNVTADALPTVQVDGVVWTQVVIGNIVYAGGSFTTARPAGSAPGVNTTPRSSLLAYDITTGNLITTFAPTLNGQVRALAASPNGTLYVGGDFTSVNGVGHNRLAAFNGATGALLPGFNAGTDATVKALAVTNTTVYAGGVFANAGGQPHSHLAAFQASNGAITTWAGSADDNVNALVLTPDGTKLIAGGAFANVDGAPDYGLGALDATTGALSTWNAGSLVKDAGVNSAITSLSTDGNAIYGTGYVFGAGGNVEGTFSADPDSGNINWLEDCHGDTYGAFSVNNVVYTISHAHYCANDGGWPVYNPTWQYQRTVAFTANATGVLAPNYQSGYTSFAGLPSPSIVNWFPTYTVGTYTGQNQAAWSVAGNSQYVVEGGEFPTINGTAQQGLVRFAVRPIAPAKSGPMVTGVHFMPNLNSLSTGSVHVSFETNWDRDSKTLTYKLVRNSDTTHPIYTVTTDSTWWNRPMIGFNDTGLVPGTTYRYRLYVTDPDGNQVAGDTATITLPAAASQDAYATQVAADGAANYWPLNEATGSIAYDNDGFNDTDLGTGVTRGATGPIAGEVASTFPGNSTGTMVTRAPVQAPNVFTLSAWIKTTTTKGGEVIGLGSIQTPLSQLSDRLIYLDNSGKVYFGVKSGSTSAVVTSTTPVNNGQWHQLVATLGPDGMTLYVDGLRVARRTDVTAGAVYAGYWHIGGDTLSGWTSAPSSSYLNGSIADVGLFPNELTRAAVQNEYTVAGGTVVIPAAPTDAYGQAVYNDDPDIYWRLDDTSGPTAADVSPNISNGTYAGGESFNVASPVTGGTGKAVTFNGSNGTIGSQKQYTNPTVYSEESWFKTTTNRGGKIMGFGNKQSGNSTSYDRHVYMLNNGQLVFGVNAGGQVTLQTPTSYNDGNWHYVVATQGSDGMRFYVDGQLVGSNLTATAQNYSGFWRVGGDSTWAGTSGYLAGTIDEVAFYSKELTGAQVLTHYKASPIAVNKPPVAAFAATPTFLNVAFNGGGSSDPDGSIASYAWNFGDGSALGSGATPTHTYAVAGTYSVTLTVTDNQGAFTSIAHPVTVVAAPPNQPPTAAFISSVNNLAASFDGSGSGDVDGTIASYAWDFGDGATGTGLTTSHTYATGGDHTVTLTVTDNQGATGTVSHIVTTVVPNQPPTAAFSFSANNLNASFDGSGSGDVDGTVASYAWNFGDGATATGETTAHLYTVAGTYQVTLTVTDNQGATGTLTQAVTVLAANQLPTAAFTSSVNNLTVSFDGHTSVDPDGTIVSYAWDFGDGSTGVGQTATHTYAAAGNYPIVLTVTDNRGGIGTASGVVAPVAPTVFAVDTFGRTVATGWGTADTGGAWTLQGSSTLFSVGSGVGKIKLATAGSGPSAFLNTVSARDVLGTVDVSLDSVPTGGGTVAYFAVRHVGTSDYRLQVKVLPTSLTIYLTKIVNGTTTTLVSKTITSTYAAGDVLRLKFQVTGTGTTALSGKVWKVGTTEPTAWQVTTTDSEASLQGAGGVGVQAYLSGSSTTIPVTASFANLTVGVPGP